jgi:hypothetical protein
MGQGAWSPAFGGIKACDCLTAVGSGRFDVDKPQREQRKHREEQRFFHSVLTNKGSKPVTA